MRCPPSNETLDELGFSVIHDEKGILCDRGLMKGEEGRHIMEKEVSDLGRSHVIATYTRGRAGTDS